MIFDLVLLAAALVVSLPLVIFGLECLAALPAVRRREAGAGIAGPRPSLAVVVPAHDEQEGIGPNVRAIRAQLVEGDRLLVVADNCTDATAERAREAGAEVAERFDAEKRGKGHALAFGLERVRGDRPGVVLFYDADTPPGPGAIEALVEEVGRTGRPVQSCYLLDPPEDASARDRISALAFLFKNFVRLLGLRRLGGGSHLVGTGMAFPADLLSPEGLASGHLTEDMELGLALAAWGSAPLYCDRARVGGALPSREKAAKTQRTRWEHGHLSLLLSRGPALLARGIASGRWSAVALALDLLVPPLSFLFLIAGAAVLGFGLAWLLGASAGALGVVLGGTAVAVVGFLLAWARYGRGLVPAREMARVPLYVLWKIPVYARFLVKREKQWVRTERDPVATKGPGE